VIADAVRPLAVGSRRTHVDAHDRSAGGPHPVKPSSRLGGCKARRYTRRVALQGKRLLITGGAGFIGTTLARRLVDANEVVALDNLHRDALSGTDLAEHPNFTFHEGDVLDADLVRELSAGVTHIVHCAA